MSTGWPSKGDLRELIREAQEHKRAWGIIAGLCRRLQHAEVEAQKRQANVDRLPILEHRIESQRAALARLEECRAFELETEHLLVRGIERIADDCLTIPKKLYAQALLTQYEIRKGPRPENQGEGIDG